MFGIKSYSGCQHNVPITPTFPSCQRVSLFESGQSPPALAGAYCTERYRLGARQRPLYAWQPVCKWVKTVQKIVPLRHLSGNNRCPDFKKRYPLTVPDNGPKRNVFLITTINTYSLKRALYGSPKKPCGLKVKMKRMME